MLKRLLGLEETDRISYFDWGTSVPWAGLVLLLLVLGALGFVIYLYRAETSLSRPKRVVLGLCRLSALTVIFAILFEPLVGTELIVDLPRTVLVLLDRSESMGIRDVRATPEAQKDAALALGAVPFEAAEAPLPEQVKAQVASVSRSELARGLVRRSGLFDRLADEYRLRYFTFGDRLVPAKGEGAASLEALAAAGPTDTATRLGTAVEEAVDRYSGQPIVGVIVLTDGASNGGLEPLEVARRMGKREVPLFPVGLGLPQPQDVSVRKLIAQDTVFLKDRVSVRVGLSSRGYTGRGVDVTLSLDGEKVADKRVTLTGGSQYEELFFIPDEKHDAAQLEAAVASLPGDASIENNRESATVRVLDEKISVLYVEGKPRWEYRYLRQVLLRDHRLDVTFLLAEGDRDLAATSPRYLASLPTDPEKLFEYDLVILGDVPAAYFSGAQLNRLEQLVRERGGSFLMLAGHRHAPGDYLKTPIAELLPVKLRRAGWEDIAESAYPAVTDTGMTSSFMSLEPLADRNREVWSQVKPLFQVPQIEAAKAGAYVLASLSSTVGRQDAYPLIAWQRYGTGKTLFVGTDQLWRLRFKRGDTYHARFWGQAIRFLTLSRLLGENKRVQMETERRDYRVGEWVEISTNVLNESFEPTNAPVYTVGVEQTEPRRERVELRLTPVPDIPGFYQGVFAPSQAGSYVLRAAPQDEGLANSVAFEVKAVPVEQLEPAMQEELLRDMAELSGGSYVSIREVPALEERLAGADKTAVVRREQPVWDLPAVFVAILLLMGMEWFLRRTFDLI
jgi:hypothetical protein